MISLYEGFLSHEHMNGSKGKCSVKTTPSKLRKIAKFITPEL